MAGVLTPSALALLLAVAWDTVLGEPPAALHPVVWMGRTIAVAVRAAPRGRPAQELAWGATIALLVPLAFACAAAALLVALARVPLARLLVEVYLLKSAFALRALGDAARAVRDALGAGDLVAARAALASLCSRDATRLDAPLVAAAAVESVAENASDSVVAPFLAYLALGVPGALFYRAVNTMDAMIGYRGRYEHLGKAAARLDDLLNLIPARVTAILLLVAGCVDGRDVRRAARVRARDAALTASPNAGQPMAAMAGLLGVELEKPGQYRLGDPGAVVGVGHLDDAWRLARAAGLGALLVSLAGIGLRHAVAR